MWIEYIVGPGKGDIVGLGNGSFDEDCDVYRRAKSLVFRSD